MKFTTRDMIWLMSLVAVFMGMLSANVSLETKCDYFKRLLIKQIKLTDKWQKEANAWEYSYFNSVQRIADNEKKERMPQYQSGD